ncbi:hypothetical protein [Streptacidiphilus cavernicola]|uniref:Uncharacterized protein n=1 Tax=Streptacidiphilus cavernicola TaxID=3342716 RepID=A0ABV6VRS5_9ACTN
MQHRTLDHPALDGLPLLGSPWSVRFTHGTRGRVALEVYHDGLLLDVLVAQPLAPDLLRGARRSGDGPPSVLAWGHLPADGAVPEVVLGRGRRVRRPVQASVGAGAFWIATAHGCYDRVTATLHDGTASRRLRVRAGSA